MLQTIKISQNYLNQLVERKEYYNLGYALLSELDKSVVMPKAVEDYINGLVDEDGCIEEKYIKLIGKFYCLKIKGVK